MKNTACPLTAWLRQCGGSEVRIIFAANSSCGILNQATLDQYVASVLRFRSSQTRVPHNDANFGIGTLVQLERTLYQARRERLSFSGKPVQRRSRSAPVIRSQFRTNRVSRGPGR